MWFKTKAPVLGDFEQFVLVGVLRPAGVAALRQAYRAFSAMADGLQSRLELT
jgi:hypothetical protein